MTKPIKFLGGDTEDPKYSIQKKCKEWFELSIRAVADNDSQLKRIAGSMEGDFTSAKDAARVALFSQQGCRCNLCGQKYAIKFMALDHINSNKKDSDEPMSVLSNLQVLCHPCNSWKSQKSMKEAQKMRFDKVGLYHTPKFFTGVSVELFRPETEKVEEKPKKVVESRVSPPREIKPERKTVTQTNGKHVSPVNLSELKLMSLEEMKEVMYDCIYEDYWAGSKGFKDGRADDIIEILKERPMLELGEISDALLNEKGWSKMTTNRGTNYHKGNIQTPYVIWIRIRYHLDRGEEPPFYMFRAGTHGRVKYSTKKTID